MKPPAFAPAYVGMYVILAEIAREHGYALAVHGTVARDFDLIAIPWTDAAGDANVLIEKLREAVGGLIILSGTKGGRYDAARGEFVEAVIENPSLKPHGRLAWNIHIDGGSAVLDVSVMPRVNHSLEAELAAAKAEVERLRMYREIAEDLISAFLSANEVVLAHFDENDQLRGNGQWRLKEIIKAAKRADQANRKAARAFDAAAGQECDE